MKPLGTRAVVYGLIVLLAVLAALPAFVSPAWQSKLPDWYADNRFNLGLDLRGGSYLLLSLDTEQLLASKTAQSGGSERLSQRERESLIDDAIVRSLDVLRKRLDESGMVEPSVTRQGLDGIVVQLPGVQDPSRMRELLGRTAKLSFHWVSETDSAASRTVRGTQPGERYALEPQVAMEGKHIRDARLGFRQDTREPIVSFRLDEEGAKQFGVMTSRNVGRLLAVVLDDRVITAPVINEPILGGSGEISGSFTADSASDLAVMLRAGALPADLSVIEERTVGPSLGSDAIQAGLASTLIGLGLVLILMLALYGSWGLIACFGLALNLVLIFAALCIARATLTLPGIAGIILVVGMAVDANILINERIREETRQGKSARAALQAGFDRATATILDANFTTLIAISLLFLIGSGPIRGFALSLGIGLLSSLFSAVAVSRLLMDWRVRNMGRQPLEMGGLSAIRRLTARLSDQQRIIPFLRASTAGLLLSAVLSVASVVLMVKPGLHYGIDFSGGALLELRVPDADIQQLRSALTENFSDTELQAIGDEHNYQLRLPVAKSLQTQSADGQLSELRQLVSAELPKAEITRAEMVGPKVSGNFADLSILAVLGASVGMGAYLWLRFERHFAAAAVLTMGLDLTKTIGFFALTGIEFNLTAVAALLALIGYTINDKVVVFDRIRENLRLTPDAPLIPLLNQSIQSTLSRTLLTSVTTFIALLPIALLGGPAMASFALPMLFGIVIGTSSSILIAAPIWHWLAKRRAARGLSQLAVSVEPEGATV